MVIATTCFTIALYFGSRLTIETSVVDVALVLGLFGLGMGVFMAPNQSAIISTVPRRHLATALGVANTMRLLGGSTGLAMAGTLFAQQQMASAAELALQDIAPDMVKQLSVIESFQYVIFLAAIISFLSIITSFFIGKPQPIPEDV